MPEIAKNAVRTALVGAVLCVLLTVPAYAQELIVGGQAVGIRLHTKGVLVAGVSEVETAAGKCSPARDAGMKKGDIVTKIQDREAAGAADIIGAVDALGGQPVCLTVERGGEELCFTLVPVQSGEGQWMLGLWLRDGVSGIGTLTFSDPDSGVYGALGHSVNDGESGTVLPLGDGTISSAQIISATPGESGRPGELNGCTDLARELGSIERNTEFGIYGQSYVSFAGKTMETGELTAGPASILSTVSGSVPEEYAIEVNRVTREGGETHAVISVTDPLLLRRTGGIVQGMSGSPVLQNGKLVGAVTHVFVSDPTRGYVVGIGDMLRAAGIAQDKAA